MDSYRKPHARNIHLLVAAILGVSACSKTAEPEDVASAMINEAQVRAVVNEIREANLQLDSARYVAPFAEDGSVTFVPLNKKGVVMERKIIEPYLDTIWAKTTHPEYAAKDEQITIQGPRAVYTATVVESFLMDGVGENQTTEQKWDIELQDGQPKITHINMKVVAR
jgi:hypothetical protein